MKVSAINTLSPNVKSNGLSHIITIKQLPVLNRTMINSCSQTIYNSANYVGHGNGTKEPTVLSFLSSKKKENKEKWIIWKRFYQRPYKQLN